MRWIVFILLLLGVLFSASALVPAPAGQAGLLWIFATDSQSSISAISVLPEQLRNIATPLLAGVAGLFFLAAEVGLFWEAIPANVWRILVLIAAVTSLVLYALYLNILMIAPIAVNAVLLWGVLTQQWSAEVLHTRAASNAAARINPLLRIPVPWVYVLFYFAGLGLQLLAPITIEWSNIRFISLIVGLILIVAGVLLAFSGLRIFRSVHTTTIPFQPSTKLVTWGPYRFTRNPMYVGLLLIYIGVAGTQAQVWPLLLMPLLVIYINSGVIPLEEKQLRQVFGAEYEQYTGRVPRWI